MAILWRINNFEIILPTFFLFVFYLLFFTHWRTCYSDRTRIAIINSYNQLKFARFLQSKIWWVFLFFFSCFWLAFVLLVFPYKLWADDCFNFLSLSSWVFFFFFSLILHENIKLKLCVHFSVVNIKASQFLSQAEQSIYSIVTP